MLVGPRLRGLLFYEEWPTVAGILPMHIAEQYHCNMQ